MIMYRNESCRIKGCCNAAINDSPYCTIHHKWLSRMLPKIKGMSLFMMRKSISYIRKNNYIAPMCYSCGVKTYKSVGGKYICPQCGKKFGIFSNLFGRAVRPISQPPESATASNGPPKAFLLRDWVNHSKSVAALMALGSISDGSFSLASKNSPIWAAVRSAEEQQVMMFVVLSAATIVLIKHNKTGDGMAALIGAMNVVDGIPDFAPLVVAYRNMIAALQDIELHQGHKDESGRKEILRKSQDLEKYWGELAAVFLKKFGGRSFLE